MYKSLRNVFYLGFLAILIAAFVRLNMQTNISDFAPGRTIQEVSNAERGDIVLTVSATGPIQAAQELALTFPSLGNVKVINVKVGDHVLAGQTLATLDVESQTLALKAAQNALNLQRASLAALTVAPRSADVNAAQTAIAAAEAQLKAANVGYNATSVKIANLQLEIAKNQLWQSQLSRDSAVAANQPKGSSPLLYQLTTFADTLPETQRNQLLGILAAINSVSSISSSFAPSVSGAEANVTNASYNINSAEAQLMVAKSATGSASTVAQAQYSVLASQIALEKLLSGVDDKQIAITKAQIDAAQAAVDLAQYNVNLSILTAPFSGVVAAVNLIEGEPAPLNKAAITLIDDSKFFVDIPVDESDIAQVKAGQSVALSFDALPGQIIKGTVTRVADSAVSVGGVVTYIVRVEITEGLDLLRSGMTTTATITVNAINNVVRVRNRFIRLDRKSGKATVEIQTATGQIKEVEVKLGLRNETYSEIQSGLNPGDIVVIRPRTANPFG